MKKYLLFFLLLVLINTCYATTLTFDDLSLSKQKISVYYANGTKQADVNSTESVYINESYGDYQLILRPSGSGFLSSPKAWLQLLADYAEVIVVILIVIFIFKKAVR